MEYPGIQKLLIMSRSQVHSPERPSFCDVYVIVSVSVSHQIAKTQCLERVEVLKVAGPHHQYSFFSVHSYLTSLCSLKSRPIHKSNSIRIREAEGGQSGGGTQKRVFSLKTLSIWCF